MLKIRRPLGRLIFNMGIAIPGKTVFLIETAPESYFCLAESNVESYFKENAVLRTWILTGVFLVRKNTCGGLKFIRFPALFINIMCT